MEDGELNAEVKQIVQSGLKNWKRVSGVLCDRRMNVKIKGKVYRTVVRPALMYGAETWALKKAQEKKLEGGRRNENATMDVRSYVAGQDKK